MGCSTLKEHALETEAPSTVSSVIRSYHFNLVPCVVQSTCTRSFASSAQEASGTTRTSKSAANGTQGIAGKGAAPNQGAHPVTSAAAHAAKQAGGRAFSAAGGRPYDSSTGFGGSARQVVRVQSRDLRPRTVTVA